MRRRDRPTRTWTVGGERGVSDVIAFVFVFSIIITSVGVVSAFGFKVLRDIQSDEQAVNAVRGMEALGDNLGNVQRGHAPGRSGELKLSEGTVYVRQNSQAEVSLDCAGGGYEACGQTFAFDMGTLYYQMVDRETNVTYEGGAVFREDRGGSPVMVDRPRLICGDDYAVVSVVTLTSSAGGQGGSGTVQINGRERSTRLYRSPNETHEVTMNIVDSRFTSGWADYFEDGDNDWTWDDPTTTATCDFSGDDGTVLVRRTVIEIDFVT